MRRKRSLSRKSATKTPAARTIIVTEGERTEPEYLKAFVRIHGVKAAEVIGVGEEPRAVVERAISERSKLRKDPLGRHDTVWAMFDRDEHPRFAEAKNLALAHGVQLAVSNPCFELWGVFSLPRLGCPCESPGVPASSCTGLPSLLRASRKTLQ